MMYRLRFYRPLMRLAHRFNWHYAPLSYPDGDVLAWCQWCGARWIIRSEGQLPSTGEGTPK